jgi:Endonuclease NucS
MSASERPTLPVKDAYKFAAEKGLQAEAEEIRNMEIEWDSSYSTTVRRGYFVKLFQENNCFEEFKEKYLPLGNTPLGASRTNFFLRIKQRYEDFLQTGIQSVLEPADDEDEARSFAAESDLRDFLVKNLDCVEKGLHLYESDGKNGAEYTIDNGRGRIDLLVLDASNDFVVVELKLEQGRNKTIGQLLYYMGWVDEHLAKKPCRGIIIAKDIPEDLRLAVRRVSGVSLYRYKLNVSVEPVPLKKI